MKMTAKERLDAINELCDFHLYHVADKKIDALYEEYSSGALWLSANEADYMFLLLDRVAIALYN